LRREQGRLKELGPVLAHFLQNTTTASTWRPGLALLYVELDRFADARAEFETLVADNLDELPRDGRWTICLAYLTEVAVALGEAAGAEMLHKELLPYAGRVLVLGGGLVCCGSSGRHLGLLCSTMRRWSEAERYFVEALAVNERIGARLPLAHTQHDYGAMLLSRGTAGDRQSAIALLRSSLDNAEELGLRALAERVAARLHGLSDASSPPSSNDELTARESEVLGLMAIGRSNADIATALSISLNTVATHVRNILAKTGCANRTEAAAYAMRNGLAPPARL
jgi:DNA-binding CsgD family transcriptional regulator